jgi:hypothetical protein
MHIPRRSGIPKRIQGHLKHFLGGMKGERGRGYAYKHFSTYARPSQDHEYTGFK